LQGTHTLDSQPAPNAEQPVPTPELYAEPMAQLSFTSANEETGQIRAMETERDSLLPSARNGTPATNNAPPADLKTKSWLQVAQGVACLVAVAVIWVAAGVLVQYLYSTDAKVPFFLTYVCNSEFMILLPMRWARERYACVLLSHRIAPAKPTDWRRAAKAGAIVCPLWFLAQGSYNWALAGTSVSSSTILSTSSCVFTFGLSLLILKEPFSWLKLAGVLVTVAGAAMVSVSDASSSSRNTWWGDALSLFSALMYGIYTTAIRKVLPEDGSVSVAAFFGFLGAFNSLLLFPLVLVLHFTGVEDVSHLSAAFIMWIMLKGLFDNVLSDILWARAITLTSPTVATVALSLTIPIAMTADLLIHQIVPTALVGCGSAAVAAGFVLSTVSLDKLRKHDSPDTPLQAAHPVDLVASQLD
jgi:solute carrier family 35 protein F5